MRKSRKSRFLLLGLVFAFVFAVMISSGNVMKNAGDFEQVQMEEQIKENDVLFERYAQSVLFPQKKVTTTIKASARLTDVQKKFYQAIESEVLKIASGVRASTHLEFGESDFASWGAKSSWTASELGITTISSPNQVTPAFYAELQIEKVVEALMSDHPYEFYWFDKTSSGGYVWSSSVSYSTVSGRIVSFNISFGVASGYKASGYDANNPAVDTSRAVSVSTASTNAQAIVSEHVADSDVHKLIAYKDEIMDLVSYNSVAASGGVAYGDPWQIIFVFDGNPSTNVVCEGYAKAFKYLCDLTDFSHEEISCYLVQGSMNNEAHMWNMVSLFDGKNYLVDVTNSEVGTIGSNGSLFLAGGTGSITSGYNVSTGLSTINYKYDAPTQELWGIDENSVLKMSATKCTVFNTKVEFDVKSNIVFDAMQVSAGVAGSGDFDIQYFTDGDDTNFTYAVSYHADNAGEIGNDIGGAPTNAGIYWIKVRATNNMAPSDFVEGTKKFEIKKATPTATVEFVKVQQSGKTFADVNFKGSAKGVGGADLDGIFTVFVTDGVAIESTTEILQGVTYFFEFVPADTVNYEMVEGNVVFWKNAYVIVLSCDAEHGSVTGAGTFEQGDSVTVVASPKDGYRFVGWKNNGVLLSNNSSYTFTLNSNVELEAVFEEIPVPDYAGIVVDIMWYVFYGLCGLAIFAVIWVFTHRSSGKKVDGEE